MEYEVTHKNGKKETVNEHKLPKFSTNFNRLVKGLKVGEKMYDITSMTEIKRTK